MSDPSQRGSSRRSGLAAPRRRDVLGLATALLAPLSAPGSARAGTPTRVATLDYALAQTLIALGLPPVALAGLNQWDRWVVEPPLPEGIVNLGTSREVNLEILQQLRPDLIVSTPFLERLRPVLERIAPVATYTVHATGGAPWPHLVAATRALGARLDRAPAAERLIEETEAALRQAAERVAHLRDRPVLVTAFQDARNLWVFGSDSLFGDVLHRLGLVNGWTRRTNAWGFATVGVEALAASPEARLICLDPVPAEAVRLLRNGPIWRAVGFSGAGRMLRLPPVLAFGGLPSATRFARLLGEAPRHA